ncbi:MAG: carboxypeptidase M32 [Deltaproteobacteria bacterium]|nr:MAG: carboxypeptidase M32 [Deltaproteobacteria bacterium]
MGDKLDKLNSKWARIARLEQSAAVLAWDMETYMPEDGVKGRAEQLALLSELSHEWLVDDETARLIEDAEKETAGADYFADEAAMVRQARRAYDKQARIPGELVARMARTTARANSIWTKAREDNDFAAFAPVLGEIIELNREQAEYLKYGNHPYDALLDLYEPGITASEVERIFSDLKKPIVSLVHRIKGAPRKQRPPFLDQEFAIEKQERFGMRVLRDLGYDLKRGRQDRSAHPFTTSFGPWDVRITTRFSGNDLLSALFSTVHECGHALYDQGLPLKHADTPLCQSISLGIHESQSRMWENIVGRSRGFWRHYLPFLKEVFAGQLDGVGLNEFYHAVNIVEPGFIRVEADEVTYNPHVFVRFEIEKEMITGALAVKDIPGKWDSLYREYLGLTPPDNARGCLQDIHWAHGSIGYFPTYTLGNILSAQFYREAVKSHPSIPDEIEKGEFGTLLAWLRKNIHGHGTRYLPGELVQAITGRGIDTAPYVEYLEGKYGELYGG